MSLTLHSDVSIRSRRILDMRVDATSYPDATERILGWAQAGESRYVCIATVNNVMEAHDDRSFLAVMNDADLVTPDGMPLVWGLKLLGVSDATRVYGPDLTPLLLEAASLSGIRVGFYGGDPDVLTALVTILRARFPRLDVAFSYSPPFRTLSDDEDGAIIDEINASGTQLLLVGLGCPKQERWMWSHRGSVRAVMVGVGAAFDFIAGRKRQAPSWMQRNGLEWVFRLVTEPRRLWRRYLRHNPRFLALFGAQILRSRFVPQPPRR